MVHKKNTKKQNKIKSSSRKKMPRFSMYFLIILLFIFFGIWYYVVFKKETVYIDKSAQIENIEKLELEKRIRKMVKGYPIEEMVPYIMEQDKLVSIFLISIAKKESNWGKRTPKYKGKECFNYWGYRGPNQLGSGKHSCFASRQEAVDIVGKRINYLVNTAGYTTPRKMIVWKCGYSCKTHSAYGVQKWISDVDLYYQKLSE